MRYFFYITFLVLQLSCKGKKVNRMEPTKQLKEKAFFLYDNNKYDEALTCFSFLIDLDSTNGEYYFKRANCFLQLKQPSKSIVDNLKAVKLNYRKDAAYYNIGLDYLFSNDSLARYYFKKCLIENPKHMKAAIMIKQLKRRDALLVK